MAISRTIWKNAFTEKNIPEWNCPTCNSGILKGQKKDFKSYESATSRSAHGHDDWDPEWISGSFHGILTCNNVNCGEQVLVMGNMSVDGYEEYDERYGFEYNSTEFFHPQMFVPTLNLFNINPEVPDNINKAIVESFKIYWLDISSCANKIRIATELIMDEQKIAKTYVSAGKRKGYTLHKRIELFKVNKPEEAELLMAIKWIGNFGSHGGIQLTKDDLIDAFEILDHVTTKLYEKESHRIKKLSKAINKRKKPNSSKKAK